MTKRPPTTERIKSALTKAGIPDHLQAAALRTLQSEYYPPPTVKVRPLRDGKITGFAAVFTDANHLDKQGNYFSERTNLMLKALQYSQYPLLWVHGRQDLKERVGMVYGLKKTAQGLQVTSAAFDLKSQYGRKCWNMAQKGQLYFSGGALPGLLEVEADGHISRFGLAEISVTTTPAGVAYKGDSATKAQFVRSFNDNYKFKALHSLQMSGIDVQTVQTVLQALPNPFEENTP